MHIYFTPEELEQINKDPFHWTIKKDCPESIKKRLEAKLELLYREEAQEL